MFRKRFILSYTILFILFGIIEKTNAQPKRIFYAEPVQAGSRALAMGDACVSDPNDVECFYWNPASLSFLKTYSVTASSIFSWDNLVLKSTAAVPYKIDDDQTGALGFVTSYAGYFHFHGLDLGYSKKLSSTLSAGIFLDVNYAAGRSTGLWSTSGSLGFLYAPSPGVSYAMIYKGIGTNVRYSINVNEDELGHTNPKRSIIIGSTFWFPSVSRSPYLSISLTAEKTFGVDKFVSKAGIEFWIFPFLAARFGLLSGPSVATGRAGLGFLLGRFRLDYGAAPSVYVDRFHQISVAFIL
jgi:hypothetical protein